MRWLGSNPQHFLNFSAAVRQVLLEAMVYLWYVYDNAWQTCLASST